MKIGIVTGEYPPLKGGVGDYTQKLASQLINKGNKVSIFTDHRCIATNYTLENLQVIANTSRKWGWLDLWRTYYATANVDILSIQYQAAAYGNMSPPIHFLPRFAIPPTTTTFHDLNPPYLFPKAGSLRSKSISELIHKSNGIITTNPEDYRLCTKRFKINNIDEIPIGSNIPNVDPTTFSKKLIRSKYGVNNNELLLGYFGFLNQSKGGQLLIETLAELHSAGISARLMFIGELVGTADPTNHKYLTETEDLARTLGMAKYIVKTGFVDPDIASILIQSCDMMVMPYLNGASLRNGSLIACLTNGCPIITTKPSVDYNLLKDGINIVFVPNNNVSSTVKAISDMRLNPTLRNQIGAEARKLHKVFDWSNIADQTIAFFNKVLSKS